MLNLGFQRACLFNYSNPSISHKPLVSSSTSYYPISLTIKAVAGDSISQDNRAKAINEFEKSKQGVKGLVDSGIQTIPPLFVHPPETLLDLKTKPLPESESYVPTVDLSAIHESRAAVVDQIRDAAKRIGFFQVINHGVPLELIGGTISGIKAFHELPAEERARVYRREPTGVSYLSNLDLFNSKAASWRDTLKVKMGPITPDPEEIPEVCREEMIEWDREVVRIGKILLGLLGEGLGLDEGRLTDMGLVEGRVMVGHYYPSCPQPDLTVGLNSHADPVALTVLLQDHVGGLQVLSQDGWVDVKPVPGAIVINIGDLLQIISNEEYKSSVHRVLANSSHEPRVSVGTFLDPSDREKVFGPLLELTSAEKPALYKNFTYKEYLERFFKKELNVRALTDYFRL